MTVRSDDDLRGLRRVGALAARARDRMAAAARPGMTTAELDAVGASFLRAHGARSAPALVYGFPGFNLISVNDEIVHGVPGSRRLRPGDVVKIDVTPELDGFIADTATTVVLPPASRRARRLHDTARRALDEAIASLRAGDRARDVGRRVNRAVERGSCSVVRELTGHGVGRTIHEPPVIPNYADGRATDVLLPGMVFTIEPLIAERGTVAVQGRDGWTLSTGNGTLAAHEEHTVMIREHGPPEVLTTA